MKEIIEVVRDEINSAINMKQEEIRGANIALDRIEKLIPKNSSGGYLDALLDCPSCGERMREYQARNPNEDWHSMLQCVKHGTCYNKNGFQNKAI